MVGSRAGRLATSSSACSTAAAVAAVAVLQHTTGGVEATLAHHLLALQGRQSRELGLDVGLGRCGAGCRLRLLVIGAKQVLQSLRLILQIAHGATGP